MKGISKNFTVRLLGTRFMNAISCYKPGPRSLTGRFALDTLYISTLMEMPKKLVEK
jgi:hypothetical protein